MNSKWKARKTLISSPLLRLLAPLLCRPSSSSRLRHRVVHRVACHLCGGQARPQRRADQPWRDRRPPSTSLISYRLDLDWWKLTSNPLQLLFTVGMTLIDSLDSIIMLYSYAGFPERSFAFFERGLASPKSLLPQATPGDGSNVPADVHGHPIAPPVASKGLTVKKVHGPDSQTQARAVAAPGDEPNQGRTLRVKNNAMSDLSILLTIMSILVAFRYTNKRYFPSSLR